MAECIKLQVHVWQYLLQPMSGHTKYGASMHLIATDEYMHYLRPAQVLNSAIQSECPATVPW